jgi:prepilin-type N-terminal cleavage/methylation domain-containing protein
MKKIVHAFTLVEILVVLTIISILSAITFSVIVRAKATSKQAVCASNLHQISVSLFLYAGDHDDAIPVEVHQQIKEIIVQSGDVYGKPYDDILLASPIWPTAALKYGATKEIFHCQLDNGWTPFHAEGQVPDFTKFGTSYISDQLGGLILKTFTAIPDPSKVTYVYDGPNASHGTDGTKNGKFVNCMSYDTHIKQTTWLECVKRTTPYPGQPGSP